MKRAVRLMDGFGVGVGIGFGFGIGVGKEQMYIFGEIPISFQRKSQYLKFMLKREAHPYPGWASRDLRKNYPS